jgi:hypothetical protein
MDTDEHGFLPPRGTWQAETQKKWRSRARDGLARPHPCPLPQERVNHRQSLLLFYVKEPAFIRKAGLRRGRPFTRARRAGLPARILGEEAKNC